MTLRRGVGREEVIEEELSRAGRGASVGCVDNLVRVASRQEAMVAAAGSGSDRKSS